MTFSSPSSLFISRPEASSISPPVAIKTSEVSVVTAQPNPVAQPSSIVSSSATSSRVEPSAPSLVMPDQLLSSGAKTVSSSQPQQAAHKDVEVFQVSSSSEPSKPLASVAQPPILPLPPASKVLHRPSGPSFQARGDGYRGRDASYGSLYFWSTVRVGHSFNLTVLFPEHVLLQSYRPVARFDFTAMNEKFNKNEVWGSLGKGNKTKEADGKLSDLDSYEEEDACLQERRLFRYSVLQHTRSRFTERRLESLQDSGVGVVGEDKRVEVVDEALTTAGVMDTPPGEGRGHSVYARAS
ncbi:decapping 5-like protein [Drosera capensis]